MKKIMLLLLVTIIMLNVVGCSGTYFIIGEEALTEISIDVLNDLEEKYPNKIMSVRFDGEISSLVMEFGKEVEEKDVKRICAYITLVANDILGLEEVPFIVKDLEGSSEFILGLEEAREISEEEFLEILYYNESL